jgi:hypothetical protein
MCTQAVSKLNMINSSMVLVQTVPSNRRSSPTTLYDMLVESACSSRVLVNNGLVPPRAVVTYQGRQELYIRVATHTLTRARTH